MSWQLTLFSEIAVSIDLAALITFGAFPYIFSRYPTIREMLLRGQSPTDANIRRARWLTLPIGSAFFLALFLLADGLTLAAPFLERFYLLLLQKVGGTNTPLLVGGLVIAVGSCAFVLKLKRQMTYGVVEVFFAGISAVIAARQIEPGKDWSGPIVTLIGAAYIVSRGLGNAKDGYKANKERMKEAKLREEVMKAY